MYKIGIPLFDSIQILPKKIIAGIMYIIRHIGNPHFFTVFTLICTLVGFALLFIFGMYFYKKWSDYIAANSIKNHYSPADTLPDINIDIADE